MLKKTNIQTVTAEIMKRRWRWVGHMLRMAPTSPAYTALKWTPEGKRQRGRPKENWRRTVDQDREGKGWTCGYLQRQHRTGQSGEHW